MSNSSSAQGWLVSAANSISESSAFISLALYLLSGKAECGAHSLWLRVEYRKWNSHAEGGEQERFIYRLSGKEPGQKIRKTKAWALTCSKLETGSNETYNSTMRIF